MPRRPFRLQRHARGVLVLLGIVISLLAGALPATGQPTATFPAATWTDTVGSIALSSPTLAVIDDTEALVFGSEAGYLYAVNADTGANLPGWPVPVEIAPGVPTAIESSPTVAYLNGPARPPTIIVGAGSTYVKDQQGGLVAFNADGSVRFTFLTKDVFDEWGTAPTAAADALPDGYREAVFSTPAVGDITGSGRPSIVFGSYDHHLYALNDSGHLLPGFPLDTQDTIWSSPTLFHLPGKGRAENIFIGGDASGRSGCYGGFVYDIAYAKRAPQIKWQHCENQTIWSSPAVGVINSTGRPAVVVGTGFGETPPYKSDSFKLFAFYASSGKRVPGWPVKTSGPTFGSPAIGTLPNSATPAVVDVSWCLGCALGAVGASTVNAWSGQGRLLWSQNLEGQQDFSSPILVDLTGSGVNDVVVGSSAGLYALDGTSGNFLFGTTETAPLNTCSMQNAAAVGYIPGVDAGSGWHLFEACGGPVEVAQTGRIIDYPLPDPPAVTPPWSMWRNGPLHDGVAISTLPLKLLAGQLQD